MMFFYDTAERLIQIDSRNADNSGFRAFKVYTFDTSSTSNLGNGKIATSLRHNYLPAGDYQVAENFTYGDDDGRLTSKSTVITDPQANAKTVSQSQSYDALSRPVTITYPSCSGCGSSTWTSATNTY